MAGVANPQLANAPKPPKTVKSYPGLLLAFYAAGLSPVGLVYQIMRAIDQAGRGWLDPTELRSLLTDKRSPWHIYGRRNLRKILRRGDGLAWNLTDDRVFLRSPAKIMTSLGAGRLRGKPVSLPVKDALLSGIQAFKAYSLAAWHAGRAVIRDDGTKEIRPISQRAISAATSIPESTQKVYSKKAGLSFKKSIVIAGSSADRDRNIFTFTDWLGKHGDQGKQYIAWRLPNVYESQLEQTVKGRQKKINRDIDLVTILERGNGGSGDRLYYQDSGGAGSVFNQDPEHDRYWPMVSTLTRTAYKKPRLEAVGLFDVFQGEGRA